MLRVMTLAALAVLVVLLGACEQQDPEIAEEDQVPDDLVEEDDGEDDGEPADDAPADGDVVERVEVVATDNDFPEMDDQITLPAGTVEFTLDNQGNAIHNLAVEDTGETIVGDLDGGEQETGTYEFEDGQELTLICDIPGHEQTMRFDVEIEG